MISRWTLGFLLLVILLLLPFQMSWGYPGSVFNGVEEGELFTGSKFALNDNYDLMFSLYEQSGLGAGFYYHNDQIKLGFTDEPRLKQYDLDLSNLMLNYSDDRILDEKDGNISFSHNNLVIDGTYYSDESDTQSRLALGYKAFHSTTQMIFNQDVVDDSLSNNYELKEKYDIAGNTLEVDYQNNQYEYGTDKIVGESSELLWTPACGFLRIGTGRFEETVTGITEDRTRIRGEYYHTPSGLDNWKFGGGLEGFYYSGGDKRYELTALGQYHKQLENGGYYQISYEDIQRAGDTPFEFDDDPEHTCDATTEYNWHFGNNNADLLLKYDFTESSWDKVKGYTEFPLGGDYSLLWVSEYDLDELYNDDQTTYMLELKHSGNFNLINRVEWNNNFSMLEASSKANLPLGKDLLEFEISYSFYYDSLDVMKLNYTIDKIGKFSLKCEFQRDRFMLIYSWL